MIAGLDDRALADQITQAWHEIQTHPQHQIRIETRLRLYDTLIRDPEGPLLDRLQLRHQQFSTVTPGLKRYWYLGLHMTNPLLPLWEEGLNQWLPQHPGCEPYRSFPHIIRETTMTLLQGMPFAEIQARLPNQTAYWADIHGWHYFVGNLTEELPDVASLCLLGIYALYCAVRGLTPFRSSVPASGYDEDTSIDNNNDAAYYTYLAHIAAPHRDDDHWRHAAEGQHTANRALAFWRHWLFDLVPHAATVDLDSLNWHITEFA